MAWAYYNENDPFAASWLELLELEGHIAPGFIDRRSIADVQPDDLRNFGQCHFFAGIGGWSYAFRLAGVPDDEPVWTGSCPCQPFSAAGKQRGTADARHLWPEFRRLVAERRPPRVFGEQVASRLGREWLAGVRADMEALGYGVGAADLCAAGVGAPHIRQRLYWMADAGRERSAGRRSIRDVGSPSPSDEGASGERQWVRDTARDSGADGRLADAECDAGGPWRLTVESGEGVGAPSTGASTEFGRCCDTGRMADADGRFAGHRGLQPGGEHGQRTQDGFAGGGMDNANGQRCDGKHTLLRPEPGEIHEAPWARSTLIPCADGKLRRVPANEAGEPEPSLFPLAYGVPNRMGTLRGAGNAIVPQVAAAFIRAAL